MSSEEILLLQDLGGLLLRELTEVATYSLLYGVHILLFSLSTVTFLHRGLSNRPMWAMFIATVIGIFLTTMNVAADIANFAIFIRATLVDYLDLPPHVTRVLTNMELVKPSVIAQWTANIAPVLTDAIVIWRAWVLFPECRWVMAMPLSLLFGTAAVTFTFLGLTSTPTGVISSVTGGYINHLSWAAVALSMVTNAVTTLLITYKLWIHKKLVSDLALSGQRSAVQRVLFLLVESGLFYFTFQLLVFILSIAPQGDVGDIIQVIFSATYTTFSIMYPTIVVLLVNSQRSIADTYNIGSALESVEYHLPSAKSRLSIAGNAVSDFSPNQDLQLDPIVGGSPSEAGKAVSLDMAKDEGDGIRSRRHIKSALF